jgi:hypothetical protein
MHSLDDVTALAHAPELCLKLCIDPPMAGRALFGEPHSLKRSQPSHSGSVPDRIACGLRSEFKMPARCVAQDRSVETRKTFGGNFLLKLATGLDLRLGTEFAGDEVPRPRPQAMGDVVPSNYKVASSSSLPRITR